MDEPIEEAYFNWLYHKVAANDHPTPSTSYYNLLRELHRTEFVWIVLGDDNRAADGLEVRREFHTLLRLRYSERLPWDLIGCSVLEMMIAFSRRAEFQSEGNISARDWFWIFMRNLGLDECDDTKSDTEPLIKEVLENFIYRQYRRDGKGGMFPLRHNRQDQRKIEIAYQFFAYLDELENG